MNLTPKPGDVIAVWFSCGAASAVAAKKTIERYGSTCTIRILNNPIEEEDSDNQRFLQDVSKWLDHPIEHVYSSKYPSQRCADVWEHRQYMSGPTGAPCTVELKKKARQEWEKHNPHDWIVLGFTYEEQKRHERFTESERADLLPVLIDEAITKSECYKILTDAGIQLPRVYLQGYPNANCIGCVKATSPTYWNHVRQQHPEVFAERAAQSRRIGAKLVRVKGKRIYLDELDPNAKGKPLKNMDIECGLFCQTGS